MQTSDTDLDDLARRLRSLRSQRQLTRLEVQTRTSIRAGTLKNWENGDFGPRGPGVLDLIELARFYRVSSDWLFGLTGGR